MFFKGWNDLKYMAQDYKNALPELLSQYDENEFLVSCSFPYFTSSKYFILVY